MTTIVALYGAQGGEAVFDTRRGNCNRRITVATGNDSLIGLIGGSMGYVDAYICWYNNKPVKRIPAWSVHAEYENEDIVKDTKKLEEQTYEEEQGKENKKEHWHDQPNGTYLS